MLIAEADRERAFGEMSGGLVAAGINPGYARQMASVLVAGSKDFSKATKAELIEYGELMRMGDLSKRTKTQILQQLGL